MSVCQSLKIDGTKCTRGISTKVGDNPLYCWQHQNNNNKISLNQIISKPIIKLTNKYLPIGHPMIDNDVDYIKIIADKHKIYYDNLSETLKLSVIKYTGDLYIDMNDYLRGIHDFKNNKKKVKYISTLVNNLKLIINNAPPLTQPIIVYRGIYREGLPKHLQTQLKELKISDNLDLFKFGFNSCSFNPNIAHKFAGHMCCIFVLYLPAGTKGLYIGNQSSADVENEDEFILGPGPSFRVFKFPSENFPLEFKDKFMYRMACNDCKQIFDINDQYNKQLTCSYELGCQIVTKL